MQLINSFTDAEIPIEEVHLEGNQLTFNQIIFLIHQMRIPYRRSFPIEQRHHLFPHLRVLNLNSGRETVM